MQNSIDNTIEKKRLLVISSDNLIFEKDSSVRKRQEEYAKDWDEMHVIVFGKRGQKEISICQNAWAYPTQNKYRFLRPFKALSLANFIIKRRAISHVTCQDPFEAGFVGSQIKRHNPNIHLEFQCHTDPGSPYFIRQQFLNFIRIWLMKINIPFADHMRVVSNKVRDFFVRMGVDSSKIEVRPIKIDEEDIRNCPITVNLKEKYPQFKKIILMASRITKEKNISLAIRAFDLLIRSGKNDVGLVIVGDGPEKERLILLSEKLNIKDKVIFLGWASKDELYSMYKTSDIFLNTSFFEGYGMSMVEAKIADLNIVSTDVGVARDIGATICSLNPRDISKTLSDILI